MLFSVYRKYKFNPKYLENGCELQGVPYKIVDLQDFESKYCAVIPSKGKMPKQVTELVEFQETFGFYFSLTSVDYKVT